MADRKQFGRIIAIQTGEERDHWRKGIVRGSIHPLSSEDTSATCEGCPARRPEGLTVGGTTLTCSGLDGYRNAEMTLEGPGRYLASDSYVMRKQVNCGVNPSVIEVTPKGTMREY